MGKVIHSREDRMCPGWGNCLLLIRKSWDRHNIHKRNKVKKLIKIILVTVLIKRQLYNLDERQCEENIRKPMTPRSSTIEP